ncbi:hypothetical protein CAPTEDRAFT_200709 [Capitella teleta]|uniref:Uncharacterized protein n=1 Tax=Capitella teleta TaxID=283909 RepID=R7USU7_CAPTE|nr:hypothetical protein CAPTEDRAFT_200709 [Capitella teleta]|eukprot:ELU09233.1 hypothetical protein CAPTEDRAFT_200709 [Capitella teleta]
MYSAVTQLSEQSAMYLLARCRKSNPRVSGQLTTKWRQRVRKTTRENEGGSIQLMHHSQWKNSKHRDASKDTTIQGEAMDITDNEVINGIVNMFIGQKKELNEANLNAVDADRDTPLDWALVKTPESSVKKPLQHKADSHERDENEFTDILGKLINMIGNGADLIIMIGMETLSCISH